MNYTPQNHTISKQCTFMWYLLCYYRQQWQESSFCNIKTSWSCRTCEQNMNIALCKKQWETWQQQKRRRKQTLEQLWKWAWSVIQSLYYSLRPWWISIASPCVILIFIHHGTALVNIVLAFCWPSCPALTGDLSLSGPSSFFFLFFFC